MSQAGRLGDLPRSRPALQVKGSCLVRHIVLRDVGRKREVPLTASGGKASQKIFESGHYTRTSNISREYINENREKLVEKLVQSIVKCGMQRINEASEVDPKSSDTFVASFKEYESFRFRLRADFHQEYMTLTFVMDESNNLSISLFQKNDDGIDVGSFVPKLVPNEKIGGFWSDFDTKLSKDGAFDVWREFEIFTDSNNANRFFSDDPQDRIIIFEGLGINHASNNYKIYDPLGENSDNQNKRSGLSGLENIEQIFLELLSFTEENAEFFRNCLRPDVNRSTHSSGHPEDWDSNSIFCGVLGGLALYGSSLGRVRSNCELKDKYSKIRYFVVYGGGSAEQFGRLIRLLHVLGEVRHAAIFDRKSLRNVSTILQDMGDLWNGLPGQLREQNENIGSESIGEFKKNIDAIDEQFEKIGQEASQDISYRLNRAEFYRDVFTSRIQDLRCVRIHPYQQYDEFMRRNVQHEFEKIKSISARFRAAQDARQYLNEQVIQLQNERRQFEISRIGYFAFVFALISSVSAISDLFYVENRRFTSTMFAYFQWPANHLQNFENTYLVIDLMVAIILLFATAIMLIKLRQIMCSTFQKIRAAWNKR